MVLLSAGLDLVLWEMWVEETGLVLHQTCSLCSNKIQEGKQTDNLQSIYIDKFSYASLVWVEPLGPLRFFLIGPIWLCGTGYSFKQFVLGLCMPNLIFMLTIFVYKVEGYQGLEMKFHCKFREE